MRIAPALAILVLGCSLGCTGKRAPQANDGKSVAQPAQPAEGPATPSPALTDPSLATKQAPEEYKVALETSKGDVIIAVHRSWAPQGADRFYNLVEIGFFDEVKFFRAIDGFMVQFGMNGDPTVTQAWNAYPIQDDPVKESNKRGYVTFAKKNNPNSRTTQVFVNYKDNAMLDGMGFAPFGEVVQGMEVLDGLYKDYGEGPPKGTGPNQMLIEREGNTYLEREYPKLDGVKKATIVEG
ncbi:peptidylprolyl isomerase [Paraliomyxa miuraensis]|uniref:peptidylprolyl isomerase n=1 Tax=Paraliomyxa miuraensis TaxID=376150 RepID=UPI002259257D|nr:peptidylprolyl isomerase [Paraliomyxa miuraensis]MCX4242059.1 peptidylprolyl isomerase [Paraliomyxa miuraensis]